jgi:hypothetical protein
METASHFEQWTAAICGLIKQTPAEAEGRKQELSVIMQALLKKKQKILPSNHYQT